MLLKPRARRIKSFEAKTKATEAKAQTAQASEAKPFLETWKKAKKLQGGSKK